MSIDMAGATKEFVTEKLLAERWDCLVVNVRSFPLFVCHRSFCHRSHNGQAAQAEV
jgi:hypothetical protein